MSSTYFPEWVGYPRGPWIVRDITSGRAYSKTGRHFWHGTYAQACALADTLNRTHGNLARAAKDSAA